MLDITRFEQGETEFHYNIWEIYKLMIKIYLSHNLNGLAREQYFTKELCRDMRLLLDA